MEWIVKADVRVSVEMKIEADNSIDVDMEIIRKLERTKGVKVESVDILEKDCVRPIMDDTNAHNKKLVERLNNTWYKDEESFYSIINALADRDRGECGDKHINWEIKDENDAYQYLICVADDTDLEVIINFMRIPYKEDFR